MQRDLFDGSEGKRRRDVGMLRVLDPTWCVRAMEMFRREFVSSERVTGEIVRSRLLSRGLENRHPNAWGSLMNQLVRHRLLADTGEATKARDPKSHACRVPIWRVR